MFILGFDPGNTTGYAFINMETKELLNYGSIIYESDLQYYEEVSNLYKKLKPEAVLTELPAGKNAVGLISLAKKIQIIRLAVLFNYGEALILEVPPSMAKKHITGKGNANKEIVKEVILGLYPKLKPENPGYDITDAIAVTLSWPIISREGK